MLPEAHLLELQPGSEQQLKVGVVHRGGGQAHAGAAAMGADVQQVQAGVAAAVASVVGSTVPDDQPLMEAGLDSLGEPCHARDIQRRCGSVSALAEAGWRSAGDASSLLPAALPSDAAVSSTTYLGLMSTAALAGQLIIIALQVLWSCATRWPPSSASSCLRRSPLTTLQCQR